MIQTNANPEARILVVDGQASARESTKRALAAAGWSRIFEAADGATAFPALADSDLVIFATGAHATEAARELGAQARLLGVPMLCLVPPGQRERLSGEVDACLTQPVEPSVLGTVASLLLRLGGDGPAAATGAAPRLESWVEELLSSLSHDLRNPLNAISGWAQVLSHDASPETLREGIQAIERNAQTQLGMLGDLVDAARIVGGIAQIDRQMVDFNQIVLQALRSVQPEVSARGLRLRGPDESPRFVQGDPQRLDRALRALLSHALRYTPEAAELVVEQLDRGGDCLVRIRSEPPLQPEAADLPRSGIGLSMAHRVAELHGGRAERSEAGLLLRLPTAAGFESIDIDALTAEAIRTQTSRLSGVDVMVVDGDGEARELLRDLLRSLGANLIECGAAARALKLLPSLRPSVLICGREPAALSSSGFVAQVRALGLGEDVLPMLAIAHNDGDIEEARLRRAGFQAALRWPPTRESLCEAVARLVPPP